MYRLFAARYEMLLLATDDHVVFYSSAIRELAWRQNSHVKGEGGCNTARLGEPALFTETARST